VSKRLQRSAKSTASYLMIASILIASNVSVWPQDADSGRNEFLSYCASCHGVDAKGTGPLGAKLKIKPADLTTLAKRNNGAFSPDAVYKKIDGRVATGTHLSGEMPIWGCRHPSSPVLRRTLHKGTHARTPAHPRSLRAKVHAPTIESFLDLSCDPEPIIRKRILSIVEYLSQIQAK